MHNNAEKNISSTSARWGQERRLEFIDFRLLWDRTVNRGELVDFFGISTQQASTDLAMYMKIAPHNLTYDKSNKTYRATTQYAPVIARDDTQAYLNELIGLAIGTVSPATSLIGWRPSFDLVRYPIRTIKTNILLNILWSIRDGEELQLAYQSMRRSTVTIRWIAPHAIAFDGLRWHVRAWCHENHDFRDFVISRIQYIKDKRETKINVQNDTWWNTFIDVIIKPRDGLTEGQKTAIEDDFGMMNGRLILKCRKALTFYLLRQLQLDRLLEVPPVAQPLELVNRDELEPFINAAQKVPENQRTVT